MILRHTISLLLAMLIASAALAGLSDQDRNWMEATLESWQGVAEDELKLGDQIMPWVIFFDSAFVWHVGPDSAVLATLHGADISTEDVSTGPHNYQAIGFSHGGMIKLPEGGEIPPQLILFASTYGEEKKPYFVFAMPAIWRATPRHADDEGLDALITGVFVHEITHTQQAGTLGPRIDQLVAQHQLDDDEVSDDLIQHRFGSDEEYVQTFDAERDLYFAAAAATTEAECRQLAQQALDATRARHSKWFVGDDAYNAEFDEIFLNFEGSANWAAYRALVRSGLPEEEALPTLRRGGKWWSQDQGLALFLLLERLNAPWREAAFSADATSIFEVLESALE